MHSFFKLQQHIIPQKTTFFMKIHVQGDTYVLVLKNKAILRPKYDLTKNSFSSQILIRFVSPNRYKTFFLYPQLLTSKKPLVSEIVRVIGHTSSKYPDVNKNNFYDSTILKFYKNLNCSKTSLVKSKIFF